MLSAIESASVLAANLSMEMEDNFALHHRPKTNLEEFPPDQERISSEFRSGGAQETLEKEGVEGSDRMYDLQLPDSQQGRRRVPFASSSLSTLPQRKKSHYLFSHDKLRSTLKYPNNVIKRFNPAFSLCLRCTESVVVNPSFRFASDAIVAFRRVSKGDIIAFDDKHVSGICCPYDEAYILMPTRAPVVGEEAWFYGVPDHGDSCH